MQITEHEDVGVRIKTLLDGEIHYDSVVSFEELKGKGGYLFRTLTMDNFWEHISINPDYIGTGYTGSFNQLAFERR